MVDSNAKNNPYGIWDYFGGFGKVEMIQDLFDRIDKAGQYQNLFFQRNTAPKMMPEYKKYQEDGPKGLTLHSIGAANPNAQNLVNSNMANQRSAVHAFLEPNLIIQCLPWGFMGAHIGGLLNNTHIGVEMTEPGAISYTSGSKWVYKQDDAKTKEAPKNFMLETYRTAAALFAFLCVLYDIDPLGYITIKAGNTDLEVRTITSHQEANDFGRLFCEGKLIKCTKGHVYCTSICEKFRGYYGMYDCCGMHALEICGPKGPDNIKKCPFRKYICGKKAPSNCQGEAVIRMCKTCGKTKENNCIATNHGDPCHLWYRIPVVENKDTVDGKGDIHLTMAGFRNDINDVKEYMHMWFAARVIHQPAQGFSFGKNIGVKLDKKAGKTIIEGNRYKVNLEGDGAMVQPQILKLPNPQYDPEYLVANINFNSVLKAARIATETFKEKYFVFSYYDTELYRYDEDTKSFKLVDPETGLFMRLPAIHHSKPVFYASSYGVKPEIFANMFGIRQNNPHT